MMDSLLATFGSSTTTETARALPSRAVPFATVALRALDVATLALTGYLGLIAAAQHLDGAAARDILLAALFLPFVMDQLGAYQADRLHRPDHLVRSAAGGIAIMLAALLAVGRAVDATDRHMDAWLIAWLALSLLAMLATRAAFWLHSQHLVAAGRLSETIAVVGTGPETLRLAGALSRQRGQRLEIVGVFDAGTEASDSRFAGALADLIRLGQTRRIDKIVVAAPTSGQKQAQRVIHALKSLAVDILLAPHGSAGEPIIRAVDRVGGVPVIRIAPAAPALPAAAAA